MKRKGNRVVVITGASSGFGRGAALRFAKAGDDVVIAARRDNLLDDVAEQCRKAGAEALAVEADVSNAGDIQELAEQALGKFGRIDVWVNNAGVGTVARFEEAPLEEHEQVIRTNLLGTIYGSYEALKQFRKQGEGVLINLASFAGKVAPPYMSSYAASKFGIRGLGMALRQELAQNGEEDIRVSTIMPVSFDTPFFEHAANHTGKPVRPIGTVYDPKEVIEAIFEMSNNPEDEVVVGTEGKLSSIAQRLSPKLVEKQMAKQTQKAQMKNTESAKDSSGSLFRPMKSGKDVYGGWTDANHSSTEWEGARGELSSDTGSTGKRVFSVVAGIAVPVGMGLAYFLRRRQQQRDRWEQAA
jgi:NAD(P)-dependent dehydrogenase (short-subunit alcohol dehydrogenase family)